MDIWYDEYMRERTIIKLQIFKNNCNLLTSSMVFSVCNERALLFTLMKVLQHNQFSHSYTTELRNFQDNHQLENSQIGWNLEIF